MTATIKTLTVTDLAEALDTDPRTARKFLRTITPKEQHPGKGSRWSVEARQVRSLKSQFAKFAESMRKAPDEVEDAADSNSLPTE